MKQRMALPILIAFLISTFAGPLCCCGITSSSSPVVAKSHGKSEQRSCCSAKSNTDGESETILSIAHQNCRCHAALQSTAEASSKSLVPIPNIDATLVGVDSGESQVSIAIEVIELHSGRASPPGTSRSIHVLHSQFLI